MNYLVTFAAFQPWKWLVNIFAQFLELLVDFTVTLGVPSYILAVFIFTIIIKLATQPLMNKQMRSTRKMQQLTPEINAIKQRYATNPQRQNQAMMDLYRQYDVKPTAGCLPMLIQMPILIALYQGIYSIANNGAAHPEFFNIGWFGTVISLSDKDPTGWVMPILCAGATFLQQWVSTTNRKDKMQKYMLFAMPIMFLFLVRQFPLLMGFYWMFYSIIGTLVYLPFRRRWDKQDKAEAEIRRLAMAKEEEERRRKKENARAQARLRAEERRKKEAKKKGTQVDNTPPGYFAMLDDPDFFDENMDDDQLEYEMAFRTWLRGQGVSQVRDKKMRLHPWSDEEEVVSLCYMANGTELSLKDMKVKYQKRMEEEQAVQAAEAMLGKLTRRNKKKEKAESQDNQ